MLRHHHPPMTNWLPHVEASHHVVYVVVLYVDLHSHVVIGLKLKPRYYVVP
jgi:hypothetical protein